ncbi:MAG: hypothetical protein AAF718_03425 [Pseudomonadota bacterium]
MFCLLGCLPSEVAAIPGEPLRTFASCAGRFSATMEHQWLISDPSSDRTEAQRSAMLSLVDAVMRPDQGRDVLIWRIEAKQAHAVLLTRATFNQDRADATWASEQAEMHLAHCTGLLLS